jgi:integrase
LSTPKTRPHPAIIDQKDLGQLLIAIDGYGGIASTKAAAMGLATARLSASWRSSDDEMGRSRPRWSARWIIPAGNTKMRRQHEVPLSRQSIEIIRSMEDVAGYSEFVFPSHKSETGVVGKRGERCASTARLCRNYDRSRISFYRQLSPKREQ